MIEPRRVCATAHMRHHLTGAADVSRNSSAALMPAQAARPRLILRYVLEPSRSCSAAPCTMRHGWSPQYMYCWSASCKTHPILPSASCHCTGDKMHAGPQHERFPQ